jgi:transposase-like protein
MSDFLLGAAGERADDEIIVLCVRWYLTFKLSSRDLVQMMAERGTGLGKSRKVVWYDSLGK